MGTRQRAAVEVGPRFKAGDVVVTRKKVRCKVTGGTTDGWADPGWRWLVPIF
jgi:hypothetical protein